IIADFFFQAEAGIRGLTVTGVQTCALPISRRERHQRPVRRSEPLASSPSTSSVLLRRLSGRRHPPAPGRVGQVPPWRACCRPSRSEERRVGKECRSRWSRDHYKKKIDKGLVGEPQLVLVELSRRPYRTGADGWRYDIARVRSWLLDAPIHFFDLAICDLSTVVYPQ